MAKAVEIKLNSTGMQALLKSGQMEAAMKKIAASKAGKFRHSASIGSRRARGFISTRDRKAIEDNLLLKQVF